MRKPKIFYWNYTFNYNGLIIPYIGIIINSSLKNHPRLPELIEHEMVHWKQSKRYGLASIFLLLYLADILYHGYDLSLFEIEARFNENKLAKYYYTYAVRNSLSKTPENPKFRKGKKFNSPIPTENSKVRLGKYFFECSNFECRYSGEAESTLIRSLDLKTAMETAGNCRLCGHKLYHDDRN